MKITKASGLAEEFSEKKLTNSLKAVGVSQEVTREALQLVKDKLSSDTSTHRVHDIVSQYLAQHSPPIHQLNYNLKRAIFRLGPTGYPFEHLVAKTLQQFGYQTKVGVILSGKCVTHEIDVVAKKDKHVFYIECKFHNRPGLKTDIQTALYTQARFQDVSTNPANHPNLDSHPWLITNTKVTSDVDSYAKCQKMKLTSWSQPNKESLFHLVITSKIHPVTAITSLSIDKIETLLGQNIVTIKDLDQLIKNDRLTDILSKDDRKKVKAEIRAIYS